MSVEDVPVETLSGSVCSVPAAVSSAAPARLRLIFSGVCVGAITRLGRTAGQEDATGHESELSPRNHIRRYEGSLYESKGNRDVGVREINYLPE